jgi:hypothetical protein
MARSQRKLSDAEREQRRRRDRERLADAMRELLTSDGWTAWLRARATLHDYSLHNTCLSPRKRAAAASTRRTSPVSEPG